MILISIAESLEFEEIIDTDLEGFGKPGWKKSVKKKFLLVFFM